MCVCVTTLQLVELSKAQDVEAGDSIIIVCVCVTLQLVELSKAQDVEAGDGIIIVWCVCVTLQLVELSKAQDVEAGDGTTTVVIIAGSLLDSAQKLLIKGVQSVIVRGSFDK